MRRSWALVFPGALTAFLTVAGASVASRPAVVFSRSSGDITVLTLSRIKVDRLSCALGKGTPSVARFVVSDPATIGCRDGVLTSIRYAPSTPSGYTDGPVAVGGTPPTTRKPSSSSGSTVVSGAVLPSGAASTGSFSIGPNGVSASGTTTNPDGTVTAWTSTNVTGVITQLDASGITIGDLTCALLAALPGSQAALMQLSFYGARFNVGDSASMGCYNGVLRIIGHAAASTTGTTDTITVS